MKDNSEMIEYIHKKLDKLKSFEDNTDIRYKDKNNKNWMQYSKNLSIMSLRYQGFYKTIEKKFGLVNFKELSNDDYHIYRTQADELENIIKTILTEKYNIKISSVGYTGLL